MKWQYKVSLLLLLVSQTSFLALAAYHTDKNIYYPSDSPGVPPSLGYSWIWYHLDHWIFSLVVALAAVVIFIHGLVTELRQSRGKRPTFDEQGAPTNR